MKTRHRSFWLPLLLLALALIGATMPRHTQIAAAQTSCPTGGCKIYLSLALVAPIEPVLVEPLGPGQIDSLTPTLKWYPATVGTDYVIQLNQDPTFVDPKTDPVSTTRTLDLSDRSLQRNVARNNLKSATTYYWRVGLVLSDGSITFTPVVQFTTAVDDPSRHPVMGPYLDPPFGARVTTLTPTLSWAPVPGADFYGVRIVEQNTGKTIFTSNATQLPATATSLKVRSNLLQPQSKYNWAVRVHSSYGWGDYGPDSVIKTP